MPQACKSLSQRFYAYLAPEIHNQLPETIKTIQNKIKMTKARKKIIL